MALQSCWSDHRSPEQRAGAPPQNRWAWQCICLWAAEKKPGAAYRIFNKGQRRRTRRVNEHGGLTFHQHSLSAPSTQTHITTPKSSSTSFNQQKTKHETANLLMAIILSSSNGFISASKDPRLTLTQRLTTLSQQELSLSNQWDILPPQEKFNHILFTSCLFWKIGRKKDLCIKKNQVNQSQGSQVS